MHRSMCGMRRSRLVHARRRRSLSVLCPTQRQPLLGLIGHLAQLAPGYEPCSHATRSTATHRERGRRSGTRVQARLGSLRVSVCALLYVPQSTHIVSRRAQRDILRFAFSMWTVVVAVALLSLVLHEQRPSWVNAIAFGGAAREACLCSLPWDSSSFVLALQRCRRFCQSGAGVWILFLMASSTAIPATASVPSKTREDALISPAMEYRATLSQVSMLQPTEFTNSRRHLQQVAITDANKTAAVAACLAVDPVGGNCPGTVYGAMPSWDVSSVTSMASSAWHLHAHRLSRGMG
eukprot:COSAG01_NODE_5344_length_4322_cov_10.094956_2_plen_293_part_00